MRHASMWISASRARSRWWACWGRRCRASGLGCYRRQRTRSGRRCSAWTRQRPKRLLRGRVRCRRRARPITFCPRRRPRRLYSGLRLRRRERRWAVGLVDRIDQERSGGMMMRVGRGTMRMGIRRGMVAVGGVVQVNGRSGRAHLVRLKVSRHETGVALRLVGMGRTRVSRTCTAGAVNIGNAAGSFSVIRNPTGCLLRASLLRASSSDGLLTFAHRHRLRDTSCSRSCMLLYAPRPPARFPHHTNSSSTFSRPRSSKRRSPMRIHGWTKKPAAPSHRAPGFSSTHSRASLSHTPDGHARRMASTHAKLAPSHAYCTTSNTVHH